MSDVQIGWGSEFHLDDAAGTLTELGEILSVPMPNEQTEDVETTHMKSPGKRRQYIGGLIDAGEGTIEMNYIPGSPSDILLRQALTSGTERDYKIVLKTAADETWEVTGKCVVKGYERNNPIDDRRTANVTIRFSGIATEAAGA